MDDLIAAAEAAADLAGDTIRPFYRQGVPADLKGDSSPVTVADRRAEQAMRALLAQRFPDHGILGEEYGLDRPEARLRWVLDPIDGTRAFITGRPTFGVLVALMDGPVPVLGVIDQPITGERWVGAAGRPTRFRGAHGRAGCRPCPALDAAELSCTAPEIFTPAQATAWRRLQAATRRTSWGGDCYAYGLLALGGIDVVAEPGLQVWDWAALVPVVEGAGGRVTDWQGQPMRPGSDGCTLAVGDPALLAPVVALLTGTCWPAAWASRRPALPASRAARHTSCRGRWSRWTAAQARAARPLPPDRSHRHALMAGAPFRDLPGGTLHVASAAEFPVSATMTAAVLRLQPGAVQGLHWHPNANEWLYVARGQAGLTLFGADKHLASADAVAGHCAYIPMGCGHSVRNIGNEVCEVVGVLDSGRYEECSP